jgi:hypothetical protein
MNRYNINLYKDVVKLDDYMNTIDQFYYKLAKKNVIRRYINNSTFGIMMEIKFKNERI